MKGGSVMSEFNPIAVFKIGDQESKTPFLDGELIDVIDPNEQPYLWSGLSDEMQTIFYCRIIPIEKRDQYRGYLRDLEKPNKPKCILRPDRLTSEEQEELRDKYAKKTLEEIDESKFDFGEDLTPNPKTEDQNAWTGGNVTVGSGGTYATWATLIADLGTFTSDGIGLQISDVTETTSPVVSNNIGSNTMIFDGGKYNINHINRIMYYGPEGTGVAIIREFNPVRTADAGADFVPAVIITLVDTTITIKIYNSLFDGGGFSGTGLEVADDTPICHVYNNILIDYNGTTSSTGLDIFSAHTSSIIENNTIYNCGIGMNFGSNDCHGLNNAAFENNTDYSSTTLLATFSKCASSDATGSESSLRNLTTSDEFESLVSTDSDFLVPKITGTLYGAGANPTIAGHTTYYNDVTIVTGDVDIGANGIARETGVVIGKKYLTTKVSIGTKVGFFN